MKIDYGDPTSDVLTSVLNSLDFKGKVFCYSKFTAPWAIQIKRKELVHFHYIERGEGWIELEDTGLSASLITGDFVILPHGRAHILGNGPKSKAVNVEQLLICRDVL